jgi:type VI secretion system protein ImpA
VLTTLAMYPIRAEEPINFDVRDLLRPIEGPSPAGESLRYEGTYDKIREARIEDDPVLSRGVWKLPLKRANWSDVVEICIEALSQRTKDLQIATWLLEAWVQLYAFDGLREGLRLLTGLTTEFWDDVYPRPEFESTDAVEYRVAPIEWLNDKIPARIKLIPLTAPSSDDVRAYCFSDWETATRARPAGKPATPEITQAQFQQSALLTPTEYYQTLLASVESAVEACATLEAALLEKAGNQAPSLRQLSITIDEIRRLIVSILSQRDISPPAQHAPAPAERHPEAETAPPDAEAAFKNGPITSRAEAYRRLSEAADYLARTEPHSPTPYLVRRAISWGSMRLEDLLPDLFKNHAEVDEVFRLLQISKAGQK